MDIVLFTLIGVTITLYIVYLAVQRNKKVPAVKSAYQFAKKHSILTKSEIDFLVKLNNICGEKYYVVPQAHLSSFLDQKIKGQNWRAAFARINGKSVDFLLCRIDTSEPVVAIELDDYTHNREDRKLRDQAVEEILVGANMPLVRFKTGEWGSEKAIFDKIRTTLVSMEQK